MPTNETPEERYLGRTPRKWISTINSRWKKLESSWLKTAKEALDFYEADDAQNNPYNLVYSNTETLMPGLYSQVPTISVDSRFPEQAPSPEGGVAAAAAETMNRAGVYWADTNDGGWDNYDSVMRRAVKNVCVLGQGQIRVRVLDAGGGSDARRYIAFEHVRFDRFVWGFATSWRSVPWVAFGHDLTREDFETNYAEWIAAHSREWEQFTWPTDNNAAEGEDVSADSDGPRSVGSTLLVWEVHEVATGRITHVTEPFLDAEPDVRPEGYSSEDGGALLQEAMTPLTFRFPCPEPLAFSRRERDFIPIPQYAYYREQYDTLQVLAVRHSRLADAIRVRGVYNNQVEEIKRLLSEDKDNALLPAENVPALMANGGLEKNIWFLPIGEFIEALVQVTAEIEKLKQVIFEISGISDIQRGASNPNETLGAQQLKDRWSTLRLKQMQTTVANFARDAFRIAAELAGATFAPEDWRAITQLPFPTAKEKEAALAELAELAQAKAAHDAAMAALGPPPGTMLPQGGGPPPGNDMLINPTTSSGAGGAGTQGAPLQARSVLQPGMTPPEGAGGGMPLGMPPSPPEGAPVLPPAPPEPPPELLALLEKPSWDDISAFLKDRFARQYRLDIETDSTVDIEATENKESVGAYLNGASQLILALQPLVDSGLMDMATVKTILQEVSKLYPFGRKIAWALEKLKDGSGAQQPGGDDQAKADQADALKAKEASQSAAHQAELKTVAATNASAMLRKDEEIYRLKTQLATMQGQLKGLQIEKQAAEQVRGIDDAARAAGDELQAREQGLADREQQFGNQQNLAAAKADNRDLKSKIAQKPKGNSK